LKSSIFRIKLIIEEVKWWYCCERYCWFSC